MNKYPQLLVVSEYLIRYTDSGEDKKVDKTLLIEGIVHFLFLFIPLTLKECHIDLLILLLLVNMCTKKK